VRIGQVRRLRHQHDVREQGDGGAEPYRRPVDGRDDRQRALGHAAHDRGRAHHVLAPQPVVALQVLNVVQVPTRAERPAGPGQDDRSGFGVVREQLPHDGDRLVQSQVDRVERVGTVHRHDAQRATLLDEQLRSEPVVPLRHGRDPASVR
jgi:hypothetical protein